jgi:predicted amidohydrolase
MQASDFKIAIVSLSVQSIDLETFANYLEDLVCDAKSLSTDIILFPEFSIAPILTVMSDDLFRATAFLEEKLIVLAKRYQIYICGGSGVYLIEHILYNQSFFINLHGDVLYQPKINVIEREKQANFVGGEHVTIIQTPFINLAICFCYDIEFPEHVRSLVLASADLILNPSYTIDQYGENRVQYCAQVRAVENHIYVAKSCLVGAGGNLQTAHGFGASAFYTPIDLGFPANGILKSSNITTEPGVVYVGVSLSMLHQLRQTNSTNPLSDYLKLVNRELTLKRVEF